MQAKPLAMAFLRTQLKPFVMSAHIFTPKGCFSEANLKVQASNWQAPGIPPPKIPGAGE